ncbi:50S ribosomal protein L18 [Patescibacteria group bacterium]|nr:50S ribosomal protein L18 [Patescibacteria group bacterium]
MKNLQKERYRNRKVRAKRIRFKIHGTAARPRVAIFRSLQHIYAQFINDDQGHTILEVSDSNLKNSGKLKKSEVAHEVGKLAAAKANKAKITSVVFDRKGYRYHGRIKAFADGMRDSGLKF